MRTNNDYLSAAIQGCDVLVEELGDTRVDSQLRAELSVSITFQSDRAKGVKERANADRLWHVASADRRTPPDHCDHCGNGRNRRWSRRIDNGEPTR